ncbi:MAG: ABC transporter permease [candidate division NC10 bacterium]|nr:ABC transporter permease [candidate division NC10 bacterium]
MLAYLIRRLLISIPLLLGILCLSFVMLKLAPGEPTIVQQDLQMRATGAQRETLRQLYGLDRPIYVQFGRWLWRVARLDFGRSYSPDGRAVLDKIAERIPITLGLNILELIIIFSVAVPLGILSATRQYSTFDKSMTLFVFVGFATPDFWLALLLMILFGVQLGWLPISGLRSLNFEYLAFWAQIWDLLSHLILPILVASFGGLAYLSRLMRGSLLEVIRQDYIRTARAKGLPERDVIYNHGVRNAVIPVVTLLGLMIPGLLGGSVFIETVFAIPGMGQLFVQSAFSRDEPVLMALVVIGASLSLLGNILADVSYGLVDPRIRVSGKEGR